MSWKGSSRTILLAFQSKKFLGKQYVNLNSCLEKGVSGVVVGVFNLA